MCLFFFGGGCVLKLPGLVSGSEDRNPRGEILVTDGNVPKGWKDAIAKDKKRRRRKEKEDCLTPTTS